MFMGMIWMVFLGQVAQTVALRIPSNAEQILPLVFDIGMNSGVDTAEYLRLGFRVVAVEANPVWAHQNSNQFAEAIKDRKLIIVNKAISMAEGQDISFYVPKLRSNSSKFFHETNLGPDFHLDELASMNKLTACNHSLVPCSEESSICSCEEKVVKTTTCGDLIEKYGKPHYLKVDIEGFDGNCIKDLARMPCHTLPSYLTFEEQSITWEGYGKSGSSAEIMSLLDSKAYRWKVSRQAMSEHADKGSDAFGEDSLDYVVGKLWSNSSETSKRAKWQCYYPSGDKYKLEYGCNVNGKLDLSKCEDSLP